MGRFARLLEEQNPDAPRYAANNGKYIVADALKAAGMEVEVKDFHPLLYFTHEGTRFRVVVDSMDKGAGEEEENLTQNPNDTITPEDEKSLNMARSLTTKPKGGFMGMNTPQGKMDKAYGDMMNKVSQKISNVSRKL